MYYFEYDAYMYGKLLCICMGNCYVYIYMANCYVYTWEIVMYMYGKLLCICMENLLCIIICEMVMNMYGKLLWEIIMC